ncbi:MAG: hypothetical protein L6R28_08860 [Planctomycetes bacterium]|nr:hypothetical protein [Planctomycetota bacterium]
MGKLLIACLSLGVAAGVVARFAAPYPDRIADALLASVDNSDDRLALCGLSLGKGLDRSARDACPCSGAAARWQQGLGTVTVWTRGDDGIARVQIACVDFPRSLSAAEARSIFERVRTELTRRLGPTAEPITQLDKIGYLDTTATWQVGECELAAKYHEGNDSWTFRLVLPPSRPMALSTFAH